jgi:hypothetical protein
MNQGVTHTVAKKQKGVSILRASILDILMQDRRQKATNS